MQKELDLKFQEILNLNQLIAQNVNTMYDFNLALAATETHLNVQRGAKIIEARQTMMADKHYFKDSKDEIVYHTYLKEGKLEQGSPKIKDMEKYQEDYLKLMDESVKISIHQVIYADYEKALNAIDPLEDFNKGTEEYYIAKQRRQAVLLGLINKIIIIKLK